MVYAGKLGKQKVSLGVSGRLKDRNLVMWDEETNSLWSQITGKALWGKSKGASLDMLPAIFVGLGTWKRLHPSTKVLDLSTVRTKPWYFTTEDLARGRAGSGRSSQQLAIGLRHDEDTLAVPMERLLDKRLLEVTVGGLPIVVVWHDDERAALVYRRVPAGNVQRLALRDGSIVANDGDRRWSVLTGKSQKAGTPDLSRFPYLPTFVNAWRTYYPEGRILE